jgi:phospholipid/cholesterol/gamma-HCH transport system substrate-binding protein
MKRNIFESIVGIVVIGVALYFFCFAYKTADVNVGNRDAYEVTAKFSRIDGINPGSEIRIGGIKVGEVKSLKLDPTSYMAIAIMNIDNKIKVPSDSTIQILSDGLLGGKFLNIEPGSDQELLTAGQEIKYTQSSISIENLISKYIFGGNKKD